MPSQPTVWRYRDKAGPNSTWWEYTDVAPEADGSRVIEAYTLASEVRQPWDAFLRARAAAIDWLASTDGGPHADAAIAVILSMDSEQVTLIRTRDRALD